MCEGCAGICHSAQVKQQPDLVEVQGWCCDRRLSSPLKQTVQQALCLSIVDLLKSRLHTHAQHLSRHSCQQVR